MSLLVVGSVAFDSVETPFGRREKLLGGSATHFSLSASFFTDVRVVGVVGGDFGEEEMAVFRERGINTDDIERVEKRARLHAAQVLPAHQTQRELAQSRARHVVAPRGRR